MQFYYRNNYLKEQGSHSGGGNYNNQKYSPTKGAKNQEIEAKNSSITSSCECLEPASPILRHNAQRKKKSNKKAYREDFCASKIQQPVLTYQAKK
jgi:hypothetical protein